ncbi:MAG: RNA-binding protein [Lachnospiraceae bacterium]|jgi:hypothetical protein|nr:RNA-binding protein [Lachnospiraceae bacterium]
MELITGMAVYSRAGHDKNELYLIREINGEVLYLVNGDSRTNLNPKKKNKKHVQGINRCFDIRDVNDVEIKKILKDLSKEEQCPKRM